MKQAEFETHTSILKQARLEQAKDMSSQANLYWNEIKTSKPQFDKSEFEFSLESFFFLFFFSLIFIN